MTRGTADVVETSEAPAELGRLSRFPVRRVVQWVVGVGVLLLAAYGTYETIQLGRFSGAAWRDLLVFGVAQGAIYALIALGYTMVYGILNMINFAHGEVFMAGAFASYFVARTLQNSGFLQSNPVVSIAILMVVAMAGSVGVAVLLERVAYRRLRKAPRLVPLITAIGASLFLQNTAKGFFGPQTRGYPTPDVLGGTWTVLGIPILRTQVIVIVGAILAMVGLIMFVARTRTGKSMRAVAEDKEIASLMGIDVDRVVVTTFAIGGMLAGIAAVLFTMVFQVVGPFMGFIPGIKAFTAAVLGGIGSIAGAALGGLILGLLEAVGPSLFLTGLGVKGPNQLKDVIAFSILVLVLIFRPGGLLGSDEAEKV
ncbi:MAG TPA: branched-chain amino acid ABC transporter permease [Actinomycetota bacterium]